MRSKHPTMISIFANEVVSIFEAAKAGHIPHSSAAWAIGAMAAYWATDHQDLSQPCGFRTRASLETAIQDMTRRAVLKALEGGAA